MEITHEVQPGNSHKTSAERVRRYRERQKLKNPIEKKLPTRSSQRCKEYYERKKSKNRTNETNSTMEFNGLANLEYDVKFSQNSKSPGQAVRKITNDDTGCGVTIKHEVQDSSSFSKLDAITSQVIVKEEVDCVDAVHDDDTGCGLTIKQEVQDSSSFSKLDAITSQVIIKEEVEVDCVDAVHDGISDNIEIVEQEEIEKFHVKPVAVWIKQENNLYYEETQEDDTQDNDSVNHMGFGITLQDSIELEMKRRERCCPICSREFSQKHGLLMHMIISHKNEKLRFKFCDPRTLISNWTIIHKNQKMFCELCGYRTSRSNLLLHHLTYFHKQCPYCRYNSKRLYDLTAHISKHGKIVHQCSYCGYETFKLSHFDTHILRCPHTPKKMHTCPHCDYKAVYPRVLERHLTLNHNIIANCIN